MKTALFQLALAALISALAFFAPAQAKMAPPMLLSALTVEQVESEGICLISGCEHVATTILLEPAIAKQLTALRKDARPWRRALSWLCNSKGVCNLSNEYPAPAQEDQSALSPHASDPNFVANLPLTQLKAALSDSAPQVRAMAVLRLDLRSAGARQAAQALLKDAAWVEPLPYSVADHAYSVLKARFPNDYSTRGLAALNDARGVDGFAGLRMPYAKRASDWQAKIASYPNTTGAAAFQGAENFSNPQWERAVLAGFWHGATAKQLSAALAHADPTVRLAAFDALLIREQRPDSATLALRAFELGGERNIGDCIPRAQSIALPLFTAILQTAQHEQARLFLDALPLTNATKSAASNLQGGAFARINKFSGPRVDIADYLMRHPSEAKLFAPTLRRWVTADVPYALAALSKLGLQADLQHLQSAAEAGDFSQLLGRDDAPIYAAALAYYQARRSKVAAGINAIPTGQIERGGVAGQWFQYVYSLPEAKAMALFGEIFAEATPVAARSVQLRTLQQALYYTPTRLAINQALWYQHQILLPAQAEAVLAADPKAAPSAARLLNDSTWKSQIGDPNALEKSEYCDHYAGVVAPLMHQLAPKVQQLYILHALNNEPACALARYLSAGGTSSESAQRAIQQALRARIARERGAIKTMLEQQLHSLKFLWPGLDG
jgi:hypothetical protein